MELSKWSLSLLTANRRYLTHAPVVSLSAYRELVAILTKAPMPPVRTTVSPELAFELLNNDPDFVLTRRFGYSMTALLEKYPDGVPKRLVSQALGIPEGELAIRFDAVVQELKRLVNTPK